MVSGSNIQTDYLQNNGGRDYFGNNVPNTIPPTIGAFNYNTLETFELNDFLDECVIVYPNPTSNKINIEFGQLSLENLTLNIFDLKGQLVYKTEEIESSMIIDVSNFTKGLYKLEIFNQNHHINKKILIE